MLVLTRKIGEEVVIHVGDVQIVVALVQVQGERARLGFDAPRDVKINRREVANAIAAGKVSPVGSSNGKR